MSSAIVRIFSPRSFRRKQEAERVRQLRVRDGDTCARCRRAVRFDVPDGHDQGARVEEIRAGSEGLDNFRLTHRRCNAPGLDHTAEVGERLRRKAEAALLSKPRKRRAKKAA